MKEKVKEFQPKQKSFNQSRRVSTKAEEFQPKQKSFNPNKTVIDIFIHLSGYTEVSAYWQRANQLA